MKTKKDDGQILKEVINILGMDTASFGLYAVFNSKKLREIAKDFSLTEEQSRVLNERLDLLK